MNIFNAIIDYFRSAKNELGKVTWPSKDQTVRYSTLVIGASLAVAIFFGALDVGLSNVVTASLAAKKIQTPAAETAPTVPTTVNLDNVQVDSQPAGQPAAQPTVDFKNIQPIQTPGAGQNDSSQTPQF